MIPGPRWLLALALAMAWALVLAGCGTEHLPSAPSTPTGPALLLAFTSNRPPSTVSTLDLYFKDISSDEAAFRVPNIGSTTTTDGPCALAGDGRTMAFFTDRFYFGTAAQIILYDVASGQPRVLPSLQLTVNVTNPSLDMTGQRLAYQQQIGGPFEQSVVLRNARADTVIDTPSLNELGVTNFDPSLNGDGTLIAFASNGSRSMGAFDILLYSVPADSFIPLPGLNSTDNDLGASISADGRYIAFQSGHPGGAGIIDVYVYDRVTATLLPLPGLNTVLSEVQPCISPDGRYLVCSTESQGARDIRLYDIQQRTLLSLTHTNDPVYYDAFPVISQLPPVIAR